MRDQSDHKNQNEEEDLGYSRRRESDAAKSQEPSDQSEQLAQATS
jgi:hypothetical protein